MAICHPARYALFGESFEFTPYKLWFVFVVGFAWGVVCDGAEKVGRDFSKHILYIAFMYHLNSATTLSVWSVCRLLCSFWTNICSKPDNRFPRKKREYAMDHFRSPRGACPGEYGTRCGLRPIYGYRRAGGERRVSPTHDGRNEIARHEFGPPHALSLLRLSLRDVFRGVSGFQLRGAATVGVESP